MNHFAKPPAANLVVLKGDCLDVTSDGNELESYLIPLIWFCWFLYIYPHLPSFWVQVIYLLWRTSLIFIVVAYTSNWDDWILFWFIYVGTKSVKGNYIFIHTQVWFLTFLFYFSLQYTMYISWEKIICLLRDWHWIESMFLFCIWQGWIVTYMLQVKLPFFHFCSLGCFFVSQLEHVDLISLGYS